MVAVLQAAAHHSSRLAVVLQQLWRWLCRCSRNSGRSKACKLTNSYNITTPCAQVNKKNCVYLPHTAGRYARKRFRKVRCHRPPCSSVHQCLLARIALGIAFRVHDQINGYEMGN